MSGSKAFLPSTSHDGFQQQRQSHAARSAQCAFAASFCKSERQCACAVTLYAMLSSFLLLILVLNLSPILLALDLLLIGILLLLDLAIID